MTARQQVDAAQQGIYMSFSDEREPEKLPSVFKQFVAKYPELGDPESV
jgi:hypothetical protein